MFSVCRHQDLKTMSKEAKDLISRLLRVNPDTRISARSALAHPWLRDQEMIDKAVALAGGPLHSGRPMLFYVCQSMDLISTRTEYIHFGLRFAVL